MEILSWLIFIVVLVGLLAAAAWFLRGYFLGEAGGSLFGGHRERRIGVSEVVSIEGRRKLMLIYRDGVEHLVMTGGPIDMVIEQNIVPQRRPAYEHPRAAPASGPAEPAADGAGFGRLRQRVSQPSFEQS
jgi:hypothetical protein